MIPVGTLGNYHDPGDFDVEVRIIGHIQIGNLVFNVMCATEADDLNDKTEPTMPELGRYYDLLVEGDEAFSLI